MYPYYDIHTHADTRDIDNCVSIKNLYDGFDTMQEGGLYSIGLHPWYLKDSEADFRQLHHYAGQKNVLAVGECGLDKLCDTDMALQSKVFRKQIILANHYYKPLVIHCVQAYPALEEQLKQVPANVPVIIHGFNKKTTIAAPLLKSGYYLSFGASIMTEDAANAAVLKNIDSNKFFLETDNSGTSIVDIYKKAAEIRETNLDTLILQVHNNFQSVFKG